MASDPGTAMEVSDELADLLTTFPGGVSCRRGDQTAGRPEVTLGPEDSMELVEDKLKLLSAEPPRRKEIFRRSLWKNLFLVECYQKPNLNVPADRGTAFLTDLLRVENNTTYATLLTAGHALYSFDRIVLKHSSDLLKDGYPAASVEHFVDLRTPHNKKKGWYDVCSRFTSRDKHTMGPFDFGAIFVKKDFLEMKMDEYDMSLDDNVFTVRPLNLTNLGEDCPVFVAGYPKTFNQTIECTYLATSEGSYRPRTFLPADKFIRKAASNDKVPLPAVDVHTADTRKGMSGSPVIMGEFPGASSSAKWNVIAIHVGGTKVDGGEYIWLPNAPADLRAKQGVNLARPVTQDLFEDLKLTSPGDAFTLLGTQSAGKDEPDAGPFFEKREDTAGSMDVSDSPLGGESRTSNSTAKAGQGKKIRPGMALLRDIPRWFYRIEDVYSLADALLEDIEPQGGRAWVQAKTAPGGVPVPHANAHDVLQHWYKYSPEMPYGGHLHAVLCRILPRVAEEFEKDLLSED